MSTSLAQIHSDVKQTLFNRADLEALIDSCINQAQLTFALKLRIRELESVATATLERPTLVAGAWQFHSAPYNPSIHHPEILASPEDFWAPVLMINQSKQRQEIFFKPLDLVLKQTNFSSPDGGVTFVPIVGTPTWVAMRGTTFVLSPIPQDADLVELTYRFKPPPMSVAVDMTLPDEFRPAMTFQSAAHVMQLIGEEDRSKTMLDHRNEALKLLGDQRGEEFLAMMEGARVQWNSLEGSEPVWGMR